MKTLINILVLTVLSISGCIARSRDSRAIAEMALRQMVLERIDVDNAPLRTIEDRINQIIANPTNTVINIDGRTSVDQMSASEAALGIIGEARVTMHLREISIFDLLQRVSYLSETRYVIESNEVHFAYDVGDLRM